MSIENLVQSLKDSDNVAAKKNFDSAIAAKLTDALDAKKVELAADMARANKEEE